MMKIPRESRDNSEREREGKEPRQKDNGARRSVNVI